MGTTLRYSHPTATSTVVVLRNGQVKELRRGELTGSALRAAGGRRWENVGAWASDMPVGGEFCGISQALLAAPPPLPVLEVKETDTTTTPRDLCCAEIRRLMGSVGSASGTTAKCAAAVALFSYILRDPEVAAFIAERPDFAGTVRAKCREFFYEPQATPAIIAAIGAVMAKFWPDDYAEFVEGLRVTHEVVAEKRIALYAALAACHSAEGREALERILLAAQREFRAVFAADLWVAEFVKGLLTRPIIKAAFF